MALVGGAHQSAVFETTVLLSLLLTNFFSKAMHEAVLLSLLLTDGRGIGIIGEQSFGKKGFRIICIFITEAASVGSEVGGPSRVKRFPVPISY